MIPVYRAGPALLWLFACAPLVVSAPPERSVSNSRQFLVYGPDVRLRGALCDLAEKTKRDVLQLIDQRDEWTTPIVVNAQYPQANLPERPPSALSFSQTGSGLKLQLDLTIASEVSQPEVRRELLRTILLEMMYRRQTNLPPGAAYVPPPDWLLDGIPMQQPGLDEGRLIGVLEAPANAQTIIPLEEFLRPRKLSRLDGPGRSLDRAYSFALVGLLTHTHDGRACLNRFIANLPSAANDPMANLGKYFPELSDPGGAERAWRLQITRLTTSQPFQLLRTEETEQKLEELLALRISDAGPERKCHLDEFPKFIRNASSKLALLQCTGDLRVLATRANPIYRPLIHEYARIATLLARGKTSGIAERLARLNASRKSNVTTMRKIDDYLNWFEAAKSPGPSGAFTGYMKAAERARQFEEKRRDAITVYLDVLEAQFQD
ncbi:MAG: hypothetical protein QOC70_1794 [Verrucomicrobiota bacterium]|jgi:hypothetical protein